MKCVDHGAGGSPECLVMAEANLPSPAAGEVLIEVAYAGVNGPDLAQRQGRYPPPAGASPLLGLEVAGRVAALGEGVTAWQVGDEVCALVPGGGYAEYCVTPAEWVLPIPHGLSMADAAGLPEVWFTAWANLVEMGRIQKGDHVLVHGGAGGVGAAAIQLARLFGAHVFATEGSAAKLDFCREMGAHSAINAREADFAESIQNEIGTRGLDIVLDMFAGPSFAKNLNLLRRGGRLLIIALNQGSKVEADLMPVLARRLTIAGSTMRARSLDEKRVIRDALLQTVWPAFADGALRAHTHAVLPMAAAADAHRLMEASAHVGKIILQIKINPN